MSPSFATCGRYSRRPSGSTPIGTASSRDTWTASGPAKSGILESMAGYESCDSATSFASIIDRVHIWEGLLQSRAIFRGQSDSEWPLQSLWERRFLHRQQAGLFEPYFVQPHERDKIKLQRAVL